MTTGNEPDIVGELRNTGSLAERDQFVMIRREQLIRAAFEIEELRQAIWDAFAIMGGDTDGDPSHKAVSFPGRGWAGFLRDEAKSWREDWDEAAERFNER